MWFAKKKKLDSIKFSIPREDLIRKSRILLIDNEKPDVFEDIKSAGFSIDYVEDVNKENIHIVDRYDLIVLDFGDVGRDFGDGEGLSLLKYIKRVNPAIVVLAYTSKALTSQNSDFYRISDLVLGKDTGIQDTLEKVESGLILAHSPKYRWNAILKISNIDIGGDEDSKLQDQFIAAISDKSKRIKFKEKIVGFESQEIGKKLASVLLEKMFEAFLVYQFGI